MTAQTIDHSWVVAAPFRAHARHFLDRTGLPWPMIALSTGVPTSLVSRLLGVGQARRLPRLPRDCALRLLLLDEDAIARLARTRVPADATRRQLAELLEVGCPPRSLARYCRMSLLELEATLHAPTCSELTALLVRSAVLQVRPRSE